MNKPNFFILGAPKCGTTSMATWLSEHPEIFMSTPKEPHYYNTDHKNRKITNYHHYLSFFKKATSAHKIIGEASVWYLLSKEAVPNIIKDLKAQHPKFLVMVRNPVQMAYSLHQEQVYGMNEPIKNFKEAWNLQLKRKEGKKITLLTQNESQLLYGDICKVGEQLNRLYNTVDKNSVKVITLDDLKLNPESEYKNVLNFLNLQYDDRKDFTAQNTAKSRKSDAVAGVVRILGATKKKLNIHKGLGILHKVQAINTTLQSREKLDPKFEDELKEYFKEDIFLLSSLINKDLSSWLQ
jgi:hypothetical protein